MPKIGSDKQSEENDCKYEQIFGSQTKLIDLNNNPIPTLVGQNNLKPLYLTEEKPNRFRLLTNTDEYTIENSLQDTACQGNKDCIDAFVEDSISKFSYVQQWLQRIDHDHDRKSNEEDKCKADFETLYAPNRLFKCSECFYQTFH